MDDDLTFGASVWGVQDSPIPPPQPIKQAPSFASATTEDSLDEFDDFSTPAETIATSDDVAADDDFGDFGDFGEIQENAVDGPIFEEQAFVDQPTPGPSRGPRPLRLHPMPSLEELQKQIDEIIGPLLPPYDPSLYHDWPVRQEGGIASILATPESRQLYESVFPSTPPDIKPFNWTRSRIRRQHLIALGIPVNLDEMLPPVGGKLPPLEITTRPTSAPPGPSSAAVVRPLVSATANNSRAGTPRPGTPVTKSNSLAAAQLRLGPRPELQEATINNLLSLKPDDLSLLSLSKVQSHFDALKQQTAQTSALLTYLLQTRDSLQQDAETYNKLIAEMVGEAQKIKIGGKRTSSRRGSGMV